MSEANFFSGQTQFSALIVTEGTEPPCPDGTTFCNQVSGWQFDTALCDIKRLRVSHVVVLGDVRVLPLLRLIDEAEMHGLDITFLPQGADVNTALH